jgi:AcrR family transcriptional regulator
LNRSVGWEAKTIQYRRGRDDDRRERAVRREEWARLRRREMLAAYYEVLRDEGLQGASIAKIAKRIDAPPSLLIHYFGTKEQMTIELVDYMLDEYRRGYGDKLASVEDPLARLRAILDTFFDPEYHQLLDDSVFYACFYVSLRHPEVRRSYATLYEASLELVESTVTECMRAGLIAGDDAHELAVTIKALEEGYAFLIGGGADEAAKAEIGTALKKRALQLLGLAPAEQPG